MPSEPFITSLSFKHRQRFFWFLVCIFLLALPALIFHTTGYRLSFENEETSIVTTGGVYLTTDNLDVDVYLDEEQVERPRLFRSAYYIQNIDAGMHRIVVQRPDLQTWVKVLPVDSRIVVEASAFNMPLIPHVRPITRFETATGTAVYAGPGDETTSIFAKATTTIPVWFATSTATSSYVVNGEYDFVQSLFSTTSSSSMSVFDRFREQVERFRFATTTPAAVEDDVEEDVPVVRGDTELVVIENELYARWLGSENSVPYYYCVSSSTPSTTALRYGDHVQAALAEARVSTTTPVFLVNTRLCRSAIKIDRLQQDVYYYTFFPGSSDLVLLHLQDGIYVTEIDDRAWQNTQLLYPGTDVQVVVENGVIYIEEAGRYFEIVTEIEPPE